MRWWSLILLIVSVVGIGVGLGWWIHPGLGIAVASVLLALLALFWDDGRIR